MQDSESHPSQILRPVLRDRGAESELPTAPYRPDLLGRVVQAAPSKLPPVLIAKYSKRLGTAAFLYALAYTLQFLVSLFLHRERLELSVSLVSFFYALIISVAAILVTRSSHLSSDVKVKLGLVYLVLGALGITLDDFWAPNVTTMGVAEITWLPVWIVSFPLLVPSPPRALLVAGLAAASMGPFSLWVAVTLGGRPIPPYGVTLPLFLANYLSIALAFIGSRLIHDLGKDVSRAQLLGSYHLDERLGAGGMGEVWLARHSLLAFPAAIKMIRPEVLARSSEGKDAVLNRFLREAKATSQLTSPHSIRLFDFGVAETGALYYVMERLQGLDLRTLVERHGRLPPERAAYILKQVCHSLADAHAQGLIHRDIKPANVYLCRMGLEYDFVKVLDFGLVVRRAEDSDLTRLTTAATAPGTPGYMSPEMILGDRALDARSDLYSVGCLAYWLLTGIPVFPGTSVMDVLIQHARSDPPRLSERSRDSLPPGLEELLHHCLEKDPERRPRSASELSAGLGLIRFESEWSSDKARNWWTEHGLA